MERRIRKGHFRTWVRIAAHPRGVVVAMGVPDDFVETVFLARESIGLLCIGKLPLAVRLEQERFQDIA